MQDYAVQFYFQIYKMIMVAFIQCVPVYSIRTKMQRG